MGFNAPANVVNQLVIGDQHPYQNHQQLHMVYEDVLPINQPNSLKTLGDRLSLYNYIRSVILRGKDGETIPFKNGDNNLYDRLKTTELNPYHQSLDVIKDNPYLTLPKNMLLYRSCYPIKREQGSPNTIICARDSVGMNLRIYRMTQGEVLLNRLQNSDISKSEIWREIAYYEYIRENILKKKQCPNFVLMYGYSTCKD